MITFFADYKWSRGKVTGVTPLDGSTGKKHLRFAELEDGTRVEQFDEAGKFVRLVYCPQDDDDDLSGTTCENSEDQTHRVRRADDGTVRSYEDYTWPNGGFEPYEYPEVKIFDAHGRLVWLHHPERIEEFTWVIRVTDPLGKLRVVLHHTGKEEPRAIREEWSE
jgi:hypothetical protein